MHHTLSRQVRHVAASVTMLLALTATAASAQQAPAVMDSYYREVLQGDGYATLVTSPSGALRDNALQDHPVTLVRGTEYAFFAMCDADCDDVDLILRGPDGRELAADRAGDDSPMLRVRATASGTHMLRVSMASCTEEPCRFWARGYSKRATSSAGVTLAASQRCSVTGTRLSISQGERISATLGESDCTRDDDSYARYYRLVLPVRDSVTITMTSGDFDAFLALQDASGADVESDDDGAGGTDARIEAMLPAGTYYIIANSLGSDEAGTYRLQVSARRAAANPTGTSTGITRTTAGALSAGAPASNRTIDLSQHNEWYTGTSTSGRCAYSYSDGGYRMDILSPATCYPARVAGAGVSEVFTGDAVRLSATYRSISGASVRPGISFGNEGDGSRYVYSMDTRGVVRLSRWNGRTSTWSTIRSDFTTSYANTGLGATNMLSVELEGTTARMFVNGKLVSTRTLAAPPAKNFTLSLEGGSAVFQRLQVRPVSASDGSGW